MVKLLPTEQFIESIGRAMKVRMDLSLYYGNQFECACGKEHKFDYRTKRLCQGYWRVVMVCPDDESHLTTVKIKMFLMVKFRGFESIAGHHMQDENEKMALFTVFRSLG